MTKAERDRIAKAFLAMTKRFWRERGSHGYDKHTWDTLSLDNREYTYAVVEFIDGLKR